MLLDFFFKMLVYEKPFKTLKLLNKLLYLHDLVEDVDLLVAELLQYPGESLREYIRSLIFLQLFLEVFLVGEG